MNNDDNEVLRQKIEDEKVLLRKIQDDEFNKMILESSKEAAEKLLGSKCIRTTKYGYVIYSIGGSTNGTDRRGKSVVSSATYKLTDTQKEILRQKIKE